MEESTNNTDNFETLLNIRSKNKSLNLYDTNDKSIHRPCTSIRPQDVISAVSRQLKDIQKADCLKKLRNRAPLMARQSEFIPIQLLARKEMQPHTSKFETQCMSDTQLIDIVDSVEAMVDVNCGITQEFDTTFHHKPNSLKKNTTKDVNNPMCYVDEDTVIDRNKIPTKTDKFSEKQIHSEIEKDFENKQVLYNDIDEINTEIYREFETSYCNTDSHILIRNSKERAEINNVTGTVVKMNTDTTFNDKDGGNDSENRSPKSNIQDVILSNVEHKCDTSLDSKDNINKINRVSDIEDNKENSCTSDITEINFNLENDFKQTFDDNSDRKDRDRKDRERTGHPCSPIFHYHKTRRKSVTSPLVYTLDSFEKFESLAMPLIEENPDFDTAKHLINSQIINLELVIESNNAPMLGRLEESPVRSKNGSLLDKDKSLEAYQNDSDDLNEWKLSNKSTFVEDEIIFSSDEENGHIDYSVDDLPMTCAMKTSFYESEVFDLNKTMMVGFQTSSNKSIQVLKDSYEKAKSIFDDVDKKSTEDFTFTELVHASERKSLNLNNNNVTSKKISNRNDMVYDQEKDKDTTHTIAIKESEPIGFKTANGNSIVISEKALLKSKRVFKDFEKEVDNIHDTDDVHCLNESVPKKRGFDGFKTASNKRIKLSKDSLIKTKNVFKDINLDVNDEIKAEFTEELCEEVASERHFENDTNIGDDMDLIIKNEFTDQDQHLSIIDQTLLEEFENESIEEADKKHVDSSDNDFVSFKRANNKNIKISEDALKRSGNIFKDIDSIPDIKVNFDPGIANNEDNAQEINDPCGSSNFGGFKTANNKEIKISKEALIKTKTIFQDIESGNMCKIDIISKEHTKGKAENIRSNELVSKNNFKLTIKSLTEHTDQINKYKYQSSNTLLKAKTCGNLCTDISRRRSKKDTYPTPTENKSINTSYYGHKNISEIPFGDKCADINEPYGEEHKNQRVFEGFKTASNKAVKISREALLKTKNIFQDIDTINSYTENLKIHEEPNNVTTLNENIEKHNPACFGGFTTASNKSVKVSDEALSHTRKLFKDFDSVANDVNIEREPHTLNNNITNTKDSKISNAAFQGFKTAGNKAINISEQALVKTKNIFKDIDDVTEKGVERFANNAFQGFKTAGNKPVKISEEALLKSKKIFQDFDVNNENIGFCKSDSIKNDVKDSDKISNENAEDTNISFQGFKTANNKHVNISKKALANTKHIFKDLELDFINSNDNEIKKYTGFNNENATEKLLEHKSKIYKENHEIGAFKGFQTASNKCVKVSDEALAKSRKVFDDLNIDIPKDDLDKINTDTGKNTDINKHVDVFKRGKVSPIGFKTGTNKTIKISEDSLKKSRQLFTDLDQLKETNKRENIDRKEYETAKKEILFNVDILNTQVLNNFDESLHTEDFREITPKQCKRSGSPILSCPKAKKRKKFETPYRDPTVAVITPNIISISKDTTSFKYKFTENYKKNKTLRLTDLKDMEESEKSTIDPYILNFHYDNILNFEFAGNRNDLTAVKITTDNVKQLFVESVNKKIIPDGWLENHLKLILWKLVSYEIRFPTAMKGVCSVKNVLEQLKYRYDKELYNVERPTLRRILEKDDVSTKTMILAVVGIYADGVRVDRVPNPTSTIELLLTDGWYCVFATVDPMLSKLVGDGRITVGMKLATVGAELVNCDQGRAPWEDTTSVRLKISGNSTSRAHWDAPLGRYAHGVVSRQLSRIQLGGGRVSKARVLVTRVYPPLYVQRLSSNATVTRSERLENLYQMKHEAERQLELEKLYEEVEKEFYEQESSGSEGMDLDYKKSLLSGSQIYKKMKKSHDVNEFRSNLSEAEAALLQDYSYRRRDKIAEDLKRRVEDKMRQRGLDVARNVVPLLKVRVADCGGRGLGDRSDAMISIWRPSDAILDVVKEGGWIDMYNVFPTAIRNSEIQISAGRQSVFHRSKFKETDQLNSFTESLKRKCFTTKQLAQNPTMTTDYNEVDTIGIVFLIEPSTKDFETSKSQFQNIYLTDVDKNFIGINFWGGLKKFGYENIFEPGHTVACMNLQKRAGNTRKSIPQYRATELSVFTKTLKCESVRGMLEELVKQFSGLDKRKFLNDCVAIKNNYATIRQGTENISPYRLNNSDYNLTKHKVIIDSPLANKDLNLNLSGLDFESTFKQTDTQDISPARLQQKKRINERIAKLRMYGEPPPLNKMYIINKSKNAGNAYKSPLTTDSLVNRVKSVNDSPVTALKCQSSPILSINRTFLKPGVNPVKLNFSTTSGGDENVERNPFEEEFEYSPPLSLD